MRSDEVLHAGYATTAEEPSLPTPPATTAATRVQPAARPQQAGARQQQTQSRGNRTVIPSTVNPYEMVRYESEEDLQLSSDGNDEEYVQSDGEDELLNVGRSQRVGGLSTRGRQVAVVDNSSVEQAARPSRRQRPTPRERTAPRQRTARNEIDTREDEEEDDYNDESDGQAPVSHSEVGVPRLVCTGMAHRVHRLTGSCLLNLLIFIFIWCRAPQPRNFIWL